MKRTLIYSLTEEAKTVGLCLWHQLAQQTTARSGDSGRREDSGSRLEGPFPAELEEKSAPFGLCGQQHHLDVSVLYWKSNIPNDIASTHQRYLHQMGSS